MDRPPLPEAEVAEELADVRPDLVQRYAAELPGARAAVLTRLWRALAYEPLPWIVGRTPGLVLRLSDGRRLRGPHADPYATDADVTVVHLDDIAYDDPARLMTDLAVPHGTAFAAELGHSVASLALSRANQPARSEDWPVHDWGWEQRIVDGHPFHPSCRSRPGFSVAEQLAYGPEHRPVVALGSVPVRAEECLVTGVWPDELRSAGRLLIPVHPWQAAHVLKRTGDAPLDAHPLMSLRTLALSDGPHVKTALSARLTSSVRDISVYSIGLSATLSAFGETLAARSDGLLHVTRTLGAATANSPISLPCCASRRRRTRTRKRASGFCRWPPSRSPTCPDRPPGWPSSRVSPSSSVCGCWSPAWPLRRTVRTCWWCCPARVPRCAWSTAISPTSASAPSALPSKGFRSPN